MRLSTSRGRRTLDALGALPSRYAGAIVTALLLASPSPALAVQILPSFTNLATDEEALFETSFAYWESAILDPFALALSIEKRALAEGVLARARDFVASPDGRPAGARIEIDDRVGDALGWFVDTTALDSSEYVERQGRLVAGQTSPAWLLFDLYTVINHELAHALGFTAQYAAFATHVVAGPDGQRRYQSGAMDVPLAGSGTHFPQSAFPFDLMTDSFSVSERRLVSRLDLALLADAFGYDVVLPPPPPPQVPEPAAGLLFTAAFWLAVCRRRAARHRSPAHVVRAVRPGQR